MKKLILKLLDNENEILNIESEYLVKEDNLYFNVNDEEYILNIMEDKFHLIKESTESIFELKHSSKSSSGTIKLKNMDLTMDLDLNVIKYEYQDNLLNIEYIVAGNFEERKSIIISFFK